MKIKTLLVRVGVTLTIALGISLWLGTSPEIDAKAASLAQPTPINEVFPDPQMALTMETKLGKASVTDLVSQSELDALTQLETYLPIESIEGIQYLTNLTKLNISKAEVSDISDLKDLTKLTDLEMYANNIVDTSVLKNLMNLTYLDLHDNKITDISALGNLTNLVHLNLAYNQISDISAVSALSKLNMVWFTENQISDISPVANLTNLTSLSLGYNQISDIGALTNLTNLGGIGIENNQISDISPLANLTNLGYVGLHNNQISDLTPIANLTNLTRMYLSGQQITNKPLPYQSNIVIPNNVKNNKQEIVAPLVISDNGTYDNPNVTWNLANYVSEVSYTFSQEVTIGSATETFSGVVKQPLEMYTVIFDVDGVTTKETVGAYTLLTEPTAPEKDGYTFTGWYDAKTGGTEWDFTTDKMPASDLTLYAQFSLNEHSENPPDDPDKETPGDTTKNAEGQAQATNNVNILLPKTGDSRSDLAIIMGILLFGTGIVSLHKIRN
ncbi:LPXTG cell wall anchor domain-containing protein [Listeria sp. FSL L7-1426]|uniref:leucine-rich repeat domain-containing protein n=1 Tax=Listeria cossartiae TaxID=2838249 RepID=UPI0016258E0B|nr:leucine-rich repeat domain-containing protein [Listeria cossartiae]MBC1571354.1 LPXTG cell wall anchor domain-containing protein [Listeria cossartiae subsp. cossartiae]